MPQLTASAPTIQRLEKLINNFFYSTSYKINDDLSIVNNKGVVTFISIKKVKNRFLAYLN